MATSVVWVFLIFLTQNTGLKAQDCGVAPLNTRIVGGENATEGAWPWQVSVHYDTSHICGGTVINTEWVLTAAHCIISTSISKYLLYFGKQTQSGSNPNQVNRTVSQIIVHPNYNATYLFDNDIALMRLSSSITYTNYIRPVCLAASSSQFHNSTSCWATGWGRLSKDEPNVAYDVLQEVQIPVIGSNQCSCNYKNITTISSNMLCAGVSGKGVCQGDSGGPLQCKQGSTWIQAGISSFGIPCALGIPEVFARVSKFQTWITSYIAATNVSFVEFKSNGTDPDNSFVCSTTSSNRAPSCKQSFTALVSLILLLPLLA
ncbi:hypothetical protein WMY93_010945 [Mugilogobius chulae]|uniref:Peptidase S1 domain-containing protein n=1 Tax=Mugilogobius chulae TaxID=88201 RepID=A0AAW0PKC8_9GOBI